MSKTWNFQNLTDFSPDFMQRGSGPRISEEPKSGNRSKSTCVAVMTAAIMATQFSIASTSVSSPTLSIRWSGPAVQRNEAERKAPLARAFDHRFGDEWTKSRENKLLDRLHQRSRETLDSSDVRMAVLEAAAQKENSSAASRLSGEQIKRVLAKRRLG